MDCQTIQEAWHRRYADDAVAAPDLCPAFELADAFMAVAADGDGHDLCCIDALCALAVDERFSTAALKALYGRIVEPLCDGFTTDGVLLANNVLMRVIEFVRKNPSGLKMHDRLLALGFPDSASIARRYERLLQPVSLAGREHRSIRRILVLSRVTVGADIAITSIIVHRLLAALPDAELVVIGPAHLTSCFAELERVNCLFLGYDRNGSLIEKLVVWEALESLVQRELNGFGPGEVLLVDPDSRLSQLGLLPLAAVEDTWFLPSRLDQEDGGNPSLAELVNGWLDGLTGVKSFQPPIVTLPRANLQQGGLFLENLRQNGCRHVVVINFGVGGDDKKRLGDPFESLLPQALLSRLEDVVVILDAGCAIEEKERVCSRLVDYNRVGLNTDYVKEGELGVKKVGFSHGIVGFCGSIGGVGSLIAGADGFIGYDSCCQHLAGALETPSVIVFAGAPNQRFAARWRAYDATGRSVVVPVADKSGLDAAAVAGLVEQAVEAMAMIITKEKKF